MKYLIALLLCIPICVEAQNVSTFDTDDEGWTASHLGGTVPTTAYQGSGGNPGGFFSMTPPNAGGTVNISMTWYWNAPAEFFGEHDLSYGANLKFDLQQSAAGTDNTQSDVIIYNGSNSIHFSLPSKPAVSPSWTSYSILLDENSGWHWNSLAGVLALKPQMKQVLANITGIRIRGKYINSAGYTSGIDNVSIESRALETGPVITSFSPASTLPGSSVTITGSGFSATGGQNLVYFNKTRANITSASPSQLVATVPAGATLGPISVINASNSLRAVSARDFLPLTVADPDFIGHLLPGSFSGNALVPYGDFNDNGLAGGAIGDIDGDGLLDLVAFEDPGKFAIFLNNGQSGMLNAGSFAAKVEIPSGELGQGNSSGTMLHDFDNDGKLDLATFFRGANPSLSGGFAVSRNISAPGNILFEAAEQFYNIGISSNGLDAADLDGDGLLDVLISSGALYYARNISTPGNIEFATLRVLNATGGAVSTKDLNGDGKPEIMVVGTGFDLLENISTPGNIQFGAPVNFPGSAVSGITLADLDSDAKPDILYYRINGFNNYDLVVKKNIHTTGALSEASFDADIILSKVNRAYSQSVADLNGDGKVDILIALNSGSTGYGFGVFENVTQAGTLNTNSFLPLVEYEETANGVFAIPLVGDLNGDMLPDVAGFSSSDGGEASLILYTNEATSAPRISVNTVSPNAAPLGTTVTITGSRFSPNATENTVWFGAVKAQVLTASKQELTVTVPAGASYERVSVTRDNRTSRYHLPFAVTFSSGVSFDNTSFAPPVAFPVTGADYDVEVMDLNDDGKPELIAESRIVTGIIRNYAWTYRNTHTTGAINASSFVISDTTDESALNLRMVDLDEDGRPDIISQNSIFRNSTTDTDVTFDNNISTFYGYNQNWADFDLDGKTDLIGADGSANLLLYRNRSRPGPFRIGTFATMSAPMGVAKPSANGGTAVGDFDNDGNVEFVSSNPATDNLRVWRNNGGFPLTAAQFSLVGDLATGDNPGRVYTGDFDRDGKLDLVLYHGTGANTTMLTVFHNISTPGNIGFARIDLTNPSAVTVASVGDLDGDGKPEIITTSEAGNRFSIFRNIHTTGALTAASFAAPFNTTVTAPRGVTTGDLNLDGKPEIIITRAAGFIEVYENLIQTSFPTITSFTPEEGPVGMTVVITGTGFDLAPSGNAVVFNGVASVVSACTSTSITTTVPAGATTGPISVTVNGYTATSATDFQVTAAPVITIGQQPAPSTTACEGEDISITISATGTTNISYQWQFSSDSSGPFANIADSNGYSNTAMPTLSINTTGKSGTGYYRCAIDGDFADAVFSNVAELIVVTLPSRPQVTPAIVPIGNVINLCSTIPLTLSAPAGFSDYSWSNGSTGALISVNTSGNYSVRVADADGCMSLDSDAITVNFSDALCETNSPPEIASTSASTIIGGNISIDLSTLISDADNNIASIAIVQQPTSGAAASITDYILEVDYSGMSFSGRDHLTIEVCDVFDECAQRQLGIDIAGEVEIYNAVSPNGDNMNDFFFIRYIELLPETQKNTVTIFNRWGDMVFETTNYNNADRAFKGESKNGGQLPSGIYFYRITFAGGNMVTGYLSLKR